MHSLGGARSSRTRASAAASWFSLLAHVLLLVHSTILTPESSHSCRPPSSAQVLSQVVCVCERGMTIDGSRTCMPSVAISSLSAAERRKSLPNAVHTMAMRLSG